MTTATQKTVYRAELTGQTRTLLSEFGNVTLPEVKIIAHFPGREIDYFDAVVELDGEHYYLVENEYLDDPETHQHGVTLCREANNFLVAGKDVFVYETREAPQSTLGICALPKGSMPGHGEPSFAVIPRNRDKVLRERQEQKEATAALEKQFHELKRLHDEWRVLFEAPDRKAGYGLMTPTKAAYIAFDKFARIVRAQCHKLGVSAEKTAAAGGFDLGSIRR